MKENKGKVILSRIIVAFVLLSVNNVAVKAHEIDQNSYGDNQTEQIEQTNKVVTTSSTNKNVIRHEGRSREDVAIDVAKTHFSQANKVILVNRDKFPDAISATNISQGNYPVLYTRSEYVDDKTISFLKTMNLDEIYILGGTLSITNNVVSQLNRHIGVKVTRIDGYSRYDANVNAVRENYTEKSYVVLASGQVFADALYGVSYANTIASPVILTNTNHLAPSTIQLLKDLGTTQVTIIGGKLSVTDSVENQLRGLGISINRIAGRNRYIGSAEVAYSSYFNPAAVVIASGEVFSDALVSAPIAQKLNVPILLVRSNSVENKVSQYLLDKRSYIKNIYIQGGPVTVSADNERRINQSFSTAGRIKGNISSTGERIYHMPGQQHYDRTIIDESQGERWFVSEQEAQAAGWRKSLR